MKARNKVPNLDHIGKRPGVPRKSAGRILPEPPPEAFMTPNERFRDRDEDEDDRRDKPQRKSRERPSN
jgi:hypothetical protein